MNEQVRKVVIPAIAGVAGLSVGGVLGYMLARRKGQKEVAEFAQMVEDEFSVVERKVTVEEIAGFHKQTGIPTGDFREISSARLHSVSLVTDEDAPGHIVRVDPIDEEDEQEPRVVNIFDNADPNWNWEGELSSRSDKTLYVITKAEFFADDMGYRQSTITWYEGDKTMADEREAPIYNWSSIVGTELQFGHGSGDEDVVYIRNEELRHEYEVCRDPGAHGVEVGGMEIEDEYDEQDIRHSRYPMKFRME